MVIDFNGDLVPDEAYEDHLLDANASFESVKAELLLGLGLGSDYQIIQKPLNEVLKAVEMPESRQFVSEVDEKAILPHFFQGMGNKSFIVTASTPDIITGVPIDILTGTFPQNHHLDLSLVPETPFISINSIQGRRYELAHKSGRAGIEESTVDDLDLEKLKQAFESLEKHNLCGNRVLFPELELTTEEKIGFLNPRSPRVVFSEADLMTAGEIENLRRQVDEAMIAPDHSIIMSHPLNWEELEANVMKVKYFLDGEEISPYSEHTKLIEKANVHIAYSLDTKTLFSNDIKVYLSSDTEVLKVEIIGENGRIESLDVYPVGTDIPLDPNRKLVINGCNPDTDYQVVEGSSAFYNLDLDPKTKERLSRMPKYDFISRDGFEIGWPFRQSTLKDIFCRSEYFPGVESIRPILYSNQNPEVYPFTNFVSSGGKFHGEWVTHVENLWNAFSISQQVIFCTELSRELLAKFSYLIQDGSLYISSQLQDLVYIKLIKVSESGEG